MTMKTRTDFVTNSSSAHYIVKNVTDSTKTLLDLLEEAALGPWMSLYWSGWIYDPHRDENEVRPPPEDPKQLQDYREHVSQLETFHPNMEVRVDIAWGEGEPIYSPSGLRTGRTKSFYIIDVT